MGRDPWSRLTVITLVVGIGQQFAGGELDGILGRVDSACRAHVGPDVQSRGAQSDHVQPIDALPVDIDGVDDHLGPARRRGEHRRRSHQ